MKKKIEEATNFLIRQCELYYNNGVSEISDYEYDRKLIELRALEQSYPNFKLQNSPTSQLYSDSVLYKKEPKNVGMLSLHNEYSTDGVYGFFNNFDGEYIVETKVDGMSVEVHYKDGLYNKAISRGGEDITDNIGVIVPNTINYPGDVRLRGEIIIYKDDFEEIKDKFNLKVNRNAAAGCVKLKDPNEVKERRLNVVFYQALNTDNFTQEQDLEFIENTLGLAVVPYFKVNNKTSMGRMIKYIEKEDHNFEIDGAVVKINSKSEYEKFGYTNKHPKWAVAYKFGQISVGQKVESISFQVGRTGKITPVVNLQTEIIKDTQVSRATLHNYKRFDELRLRFGDIVEVEKSAEIIPQVLGIIKRSKNDTIKFPKKCPSCGNDLVFDETFATCINPECGDREFLNINNAILKNNLDINGIGGNKLKAIMKEGLIADVWDLYKLEYDDLFGLDLGKSKLRKKSVDNILNAIEKSKNTTQDRVLSALSINHVSNSTAKLITNKFSLEECFNVGLMKSEIINIKGIGEETTNSFISYIEKNQDVLNKIKECGFVFKQKEINEDSKYTGKRLYITGKFTYNRAKMKSDIESMGGIVTSSLSSKTDYVLAGTNATQKKLDKAKELGVKIINKL